MASVLTLIDRITHPTEADVVFTIRPLRSRELREAETVRRRGVFSEFEGINMQALASIQTTAPAPTEEDPLAKYDFATVVRYGVTGWSYTDRPCTDEEKADEDGATEEWAAREILKRSVRSEGEAKTSANV